jgi:hypothetical protein
LGVALGTGGLDLLGREMALLRRRRFEGDRALVVEFGVEGEAAHQ